MVRDLDVPVEVVGAPLVRDEDGLALSSRNAYLTADERVRALSLSRALRAGVAAGPDGAPAVREAAAAELDGVDVDYVALVDPATFSEVTDDAEGGAILLLAARVGATRLIDNTRLILGEAS
jgi:pantoate--beta-alanine ligase